MQQTFFKRSAILEEKRPFCVFKPPSGDLGATYDDHLRLLGKPFSVIATSLFHKQHLRFIAVMSLINFKNSKNQCKKLISL